MESADGAGMPAAGTGGGAEDGEDALTYGSAGARLPWGVDPRRAVCHQRRAIGSAGERLVHTEEVTGSIPVSPTRSEAMPTSLKIILGSHSFSQRSASRYAPGHGGQARLGRRQRLLAQAPADRGHVGAGDGEPQRGEHVRGRVRGAVQ